MKRKRTQKKLEIWISPHGVRNFEFILYFPRFLSGKNVLILVGAVSARQVGTSRHLIGVVCPKFFVPMYNLDTWNLNLNTISSNTLFKLLNCKEHLLFYLSRKFFWTFKFFNISEIIERKSVANLELIYTHIVIKLYIVV